MTIIWQIMPLFGQVIKQGLTHGAGIRLGTIIAMAGTAAGMIPGIRHIITVVGVTAGMTLGIVPGITAMQAIMAGMILGTMAISVGGIPIIGVDITPVSLEVAPGTLPISVQARFAGMAPRVVIIMVVQWQEIPIVRVV